MRTPISRSRRKQIAFSARRSKRDTPSLAGMHKGNLLFIGLICACAQSVLCRERDKIEHPQGASASQR